MCLQSVVKTDLLPSTTSYWLQHDMLRRYKLQTFTFSRSLTSCVGVADGMYKQSNKTSFTALYWPLVEAQMLCLYLSSSNIALNKAHLKKKENHSCTFLSSKGVTDIKEDVSTLSKEKSRYLHTKSALLSRREMLVSV